MRKDGEKKLGKKRGTRGEKGKLRRQKHPQVISGTLCCVRCRQDSRPPSAWKRRSGGPKEGKSRFREKIGQSRRTATKSRVRLQG